MEPKTDLETFENDESISIKLFDAVSKDESAHIVADLLEQGANPNYVPQSDNDDGDFPLLVAAANGNLDITTLLLKWHADTNQEDIFGNTPLFSPVINLTENSENLIDTLIEHGANVNHQNCIGRTILHELFVHLDIIKDSTVHNILCHGLDVNLEDEFGRNSLHLVSGYHLTCRESFDDNNCTIPESTFCTKFIEEILERDVPLNSTSKTGETALHYACLFRCPGAIKFLVNRGADIYAETYSRLLPFHYLALNSFGSNMEMLKSCVEQLIENTNINMSGKLGMTILHYIVDSDNVDEVISFLVGKGAVVNARDWSGSTPLHLSCGELIEAGSLKKYGRVTASLLRHGANVNAVNIYGMTPMHYGVQIIDEVKILLRYGAQLSLADKCGVQPIHLATEFKAETVQLLLLNDAELDAKDVFSSTPLHYAVWHNNPDVIKVLLTSGANSNITNTEGHTPEKLSILLGYKHLSDNFHKYRNKVYRETKENMLPARKQKCQGEYRSKHALQIKKEGDIPKGSKEVNFITEIAEDCKCKNEGPFVSECKHLKVIHLSSVDDWLGTMDNHKEIIELYCKTILSSNNMGLFYDMEENSLITNYVHNLICNLMDSIHELDIRFKTSVILSGSNMEGTKVGMLDEFDYILVLEYFSSICQPSEAISLPYDSFIQLISDNSKNNKQGQSSTAEYFTDGFLDAAKLSLKFYSLVLEAMLDKKLWETGNFFFHCGPGPEPPDHIAPIMLNWTGSVYKDLEISIDLVPAIYLGNWKPNSMRKNSTLLTKDVMKEDCLAIAKSTSPLIPNRHMYFRLSFSNLEGKIISNLSNNHKKGYMLLKSLIASPFYPDVHNNEEDNETEAEHTEKITTYMIKTAMFRKLEELSNVLVEDNDPKSWALQFLAKLRQCVALDDLNSFFLPNESLFRPDAEKKIYLMQCDILERTINTALI